MSLSPASVFFFFGALFIHEVCGGTTFWAGDRGWHVPVRKDNSSDPALRFTSESEREHEHHARHPRSLWDLWNYVQSFVKTFLATIPNAQEISERTRQAAERLQNVSQYGGDGYATFGDFGGADILGHLEDLDEQPGDELR